MQLPLHIRVKLIRQDILSALGLGGNVPVALAERDGGLVVQVDGREFFVASPSAGSSTRRAGTGGSTSLSANMASAGM